MKKIMITLTILFLAVAAYFCAGRREKYDYPLNTIEKIKYFEQVHQTDAYHPLILTPVAFTGTPLSRSVTVKAIWKGETIGLKITCRRLPDNIVFRSIGAESDRFVQALAELYEEAPAATMRRKIPTRMASDGNWWIDWRRKAMSYKLIAQGPDGRQAEIYLTIDIPGGAVSLGDRHNGLARKRFVDAFRETGK